MQLSASVGSTPTIEWSCTIEKVLKFIPGALGTPVPHLWDRGEKDWEGSERQALSGKIKGSVGLTLASERAIAIAKHCHKGVGIDRVRKHMTSQPRSRVQGYSEHLDENMTVEMSAKNRHAGCTNQTHSVACTKAEANISCSAQTQACNGEIKE